MGNFADLTDAAVAGSSPASAPLAVRLAAPANPDQAAEANALARRYGIPAALAEQFAEDYRARALTEDARATFEKSPRLGSWIAEQPDRAKVAIDDLDTLGGIEAAIRTIKNAPAAIISSVPGAAAGLYGAASAPFEVAGQGFRAAEDALASMFGAPRGMGRNAGELIGGGLRDFGQRPLEDMANRVYSAPPDAGVIERGVGSGLRSAGQTLLTLPIAMRQGGENAALAILGIIEGGSSYGRAREKLSPAQAAAFGVENAVAEVVTERLPFAKLLGDLKAGTSGAKMLLNNLVREVPGELAATLWQNFNEWANLNPEKSVAQWLGEQPDALLETFVATLVGGGAQVGAIKTVQAGMDRLGGKAQRAERDAAQMETLAKLAEASKLRGRDAVAFREYVQQVAEENGDAPTEFYIDGEMLMNSLNQSGVTMQELEAIAPVVARQLEAAATGGDIRIPVSEFLTAGEAITAPLIDHLRTAPKAMSRAEARDYLATETERMSADIESAMQDRVDRDEFRKSVEEVRGQFQSELDAAKRFTPDVNRAYSDLLANFYGATAARLGMKPQELLQRYRLRVQSRTVTGDRNLTQGDMLDLGDLDSLMGQLADQAGTQDNASGESAASLEAQSRVADEAARGRNRVMLDVATGQVMPLVGVDAVDTQAGPGKIVLQRGVGSSEWTVLSVGDGVTRNAAMAAVGRGQARGALNQSGVQRGELGAKLGNLLRGDAPVFLDARARERRQQASGLDAQMNSAAAGAERLANLLVDHAALPQVDGLFSRPAFVSMLPQVRGAALNDAQVFDAIVGAVPVDVVDYLFGSQGAAKVALHDEAMLKDSPAFDAELPVSSDSDRALAIRFLVRQSASAAAEASGIALDATLEAEENAATLSALEGDSFSQERDSLPRGQISLPENFAASPAVISLLSGADLSTTIHESGHFFLEVQADLAIKIQQQIDAGASVSDGERAIVEDMNRLLEWFGVKGVEQASGSTGGALEQAAREVAETEAFKRWFGDSKVVDAQGRPLVVYHGTSQDFSVFRSQERYPSKKLYVDGKFMPKADGWDMGDDRKGASDGIHYGAWTDALTMGVDEAIAFRERESASFGANEDGARHLADLRRLRGKKIEWRDEAHATGDGFYFSPSPSYSVSFSGRGATQGGQMMPVYLSIKNPIYLDSGAIEVAGLAHNVAKYEAQGYDGAIFVEGNMFGTGRLPLEQDRGSYSAQIVAFHPEQIKSAIGNRGTFDPSDPSILNQGGPEGGPAEPSPQGRTPLETWAMMSLDEKRQFHEQFARGFEAFAFEGKAPSIELQGVFQRFRSWLMQVYKTLRNLNVELNDDVRAVMGRMIATDYAIEEAEAQRAMGPLFKDAEKARMTLEDFNKYQALGRGATEASVDQLQTRSLADMKWLGRARDKALKARQQEVDDLRREVRNEVSEEVYQEPTYQAWQFLTSKSNDAAEAGKLRTEELREMYGSGEDAIWRKLSARRMTSDATGRSPESVAEDFGLDSGDALVKALAEAMPPSEVIDARTDQRMLERFGDITSPEALERAADEAVHNEARARFIAAELKALQAANEVRADTGKRTKQGRKLTADVLASAAKDYAAQIIARQRVRELRPAQYAAAEVRSAKLAEKAFASGKLEEAAMHKRNQLVNHYAAKAAYEAQAEVKKHSDYFRKFEKRPASVEPGYLDQIDGMLERFDFKPVSLREVDRRKSLMAWYDEQVAMGVVPAIPDELLDEANRTSYKDMTMEELRGLRDAVRNIEHLGRLKNKLMLARDQRTFDAIADEIAQTIRDNGGDPREVKLEGEKGVKPWFDGLAAMHRKLSSYFRQMDGGRDDGPLFQYIGRAMNERGAWEDTQIEQATVKLQALYKPLTKMRGGITGARSKLFIPAINASLTRGGRLAVALNWGNADNRQRIMDGDKWSEGQVNAIIGTLTSEELAFVNGVWEFLDSYWPEIAAKERRITGVAPEKVKAEPFVVKSADGVDVSMRGGYYPLKYDTDRSDRADTQEAAQVAKEMMRGAMTRATTRRGHTKERLQEVKRAVRKDLNVITQHVTQVVHDLAWHEWLIDTNRLLRDDRVVDAIRKHYGPKVLKTMRDNIAGIATADVVPQTDVDRALLVLRSNVSRATMGASLTTAFLQPFGLTQSMARIGTKHVLRGGARWAGDAVRMENTLAWVQDKSEFMRLRAKSFNRELREIHGTVAGKSAAMRAVDGGLFWLMQKMQLVADVPTWVGQYEKSIGEGLDDEAAVAQADRAVIESQGAGQTKDLAEVQRKHPMLTQFYSYFSVTLNLVAEKTATTDFKSPRAVAGWLGDMALLLVVPAILPAMLMDFARGGDDDDEDGDIAKKIAKWQLAYMLGLVVGVRETSGMLEGYDYAGPPVGRVVADIGKAGKQTAQGEVDEPAVLAYARLLGTAFGLPVTQVIRSYRGWKAWDEGEAGPQAMLFGPPPKR